MDSAMKRERMQQSGIRLPAELFVKLDAMALEERRTRSDMIRILLERAVDVAYP